MAHGEFITMAYFNKKNNTASVVVYHRDTGTQGIRANPYGPPLILQM